MKTEYTDPQQAFFWMPLGQPMQDSSPVVNHQRILLGWDSSGKHGWEAEADDFEVRRVNPGNWTQTEIFAFARALALANPGEKVVCQWWDRRKRIWNNHPFGHFVYPAGTIINPDGTVPGAIGTTRETSREQQKAAAIRADNQRKIDEVYSRRRGKPLKLGPAMPRKKPGKPAKARS